MAFIAVLNKYKLSKNFSKTFFRMYSIPKKKQLGSETALAYFDQFYSPVYKDWSSIRLALLCNNNYCAVLNAFNRNKSVLELFEGMDVFNMKEAFHLNLAKGNESDIAHENETEKHEDDKIENETNNCNQFTLVDAEDVDHQEYMPATKLKHRDFDLEEEYSEYFMPDINYEAEIVKHGVIHFPASWEIYLCSRGKFTRFPPPKVDATGLLNYYLMDGASILPVLALDVQKGEEVGDLCASPGGKSLSILFGLQFGKLVCNDASLSRVNKLKTVLNSYLPATENWSKRILVSNLDVCDWTYFDAFDKILLDVPCTNDRMSVMKDANNIFHQKRFYERMQIPQMQTMMLCAALKALKPGGSLVYSTCSLSPLQNDGVVHMSLSRLSKEFSSKFYVQDLSEAFLPLKTMYKFSDTCRYGQLVVPFLPLNYGPMYISKISREK